MMTVAATAVWAAHNFNDVPDSNTFHADIEWLADNDVTRGCNPPTNDEFCPDDQVTREQMSAFMHRLAEAFGSAGDQETGTGDPITVDSTTATELLSVEVTPKSDANVVLNGHVTIEVDTGAEGRFEVTIARDDCAGTVVGAGTWRATQDEGAFPNDTVAITGFDTVAADTTYVLCAGKGAPGSLDGTALRRGLTAAWNPLG